MADIFVSYTRSDRDWAHWIGLELQKLGHTPHVHEWEVQGGSDIFAWMERHLDSADHVLCVVSDDYLKAPFSTLERNAALWLATKERQNFVLFVVVKPCRLPNLVDHFKRCELFGLPEEARRTRFHAYMSRPTAPAGGLTVSTQVFAVSNIPIRVPEHFLGRDDALAAVDAVLKRYEGRVAITALHGLRGVGKTTLAAAYADRHRADYRATWWIRAQTESTMRADLAALGVRLGWVAADEKEEPALARVRERLRYEGEGLLLIYDNAIDAASLKPHLPPGGAARVLVTSKAHAWRGVAAPVEIRLWPKQIGADYLVARTGRDKERAAAEALSDALGGLPLAHEQAAAYCERLDVSLADYSRRFDVAPAKLLDAAKDAPGEYHDGLTVAKTFALAIDEAGKLHPAAEPLIVRAALLAPEPIPLFLFTEGREKFGEPLASLLTDDGLDEALAALRAFALVDRETIADERDPAITTETIRLHRLVREVAAGRCLGEAREAARRVWAEVLVGAFPESVFDDPGIWPRARRLDALALGDSAGQSNGGELQDSALLNSLGAYRFGPLAAYAKARTFLERALFIREKALGPEHPKTAESLNNLAFLLQKAGDLVSARPLLERAVAILEKEFGPEHPETVTGLDNLGFLLHDHGDFASARPLCERALAIRERVLGPEHPHTARSLDYLGRLFQDRGDLAGARPLFERALVIREKTLGPEDPQTAVSLNNLARLLHNQGDLAGARPLFERALAIDEQALGPEHPETATNLDNLAILLHDQGDLAAARPLFERALAIRERVLGPEHPQTAISLSSLARLLQDQGDVAGARPLSERALAIREKALGSEHPQTAISLNNLARLLQNQGDLAGARPLFERALAIDQRVLGPEHPETATTLNNLAVLLQDQGDLAGARPLFERALAIREKALGPEHPRTVTTLNNLAMLFQAQGDWKAARPLLECGIKIGEKALGADHPDVATGVSNLARVLRDAGQPGEAERLFIRAIAIGEKALGRDHLLTQRFASHYARLLCETGRPAEALPRAQAALAAHERHSGPNHPRTRDSARVTADALDALGRAEEAAAVRARFGLGGGREPFSRSSR